MLRLNDAFTLSEHWQSDRLSALQARKLAIPFLAPKERMI